MKSTLATIICLASAVCASLQASTWNFNDTTALNDWRMIGRVRQTAQNLQIGPSDGSYAISGIRTKAAASPSKNFTLKVVVSAFAVTVPAPDDLENENDIRINIVLSPDWSPAWENDKAVLNVALFFNSRQGGVFAGLFGKGAGRPNQGAEALSAGAFLGEGFIDGDLTVEIALDEKKATARFSRGDILLNTLEAPLDERLTSLLDTPLHTSVYQQNIGPGTGTFILQTVEQK